MGLGHRNHQWIAHDDPSPRDRRARTAYEETRYRFCPGAAPPPVQEELISCHSTVAPGTPDILLYSRRVLVKNGRGDEARAQRERAAARIGAAHDMTQALGPGQQQARLIEQRGCRP